MTAQGRKGQISTTKNNAKGKWTPLRKQLQSMPPRVKKARVELEQNSD